MKDIMMAQEKFIRKCRVLKFPSTEEFEQAVELRAESGWYLQSWNIDADWGIVAVFRTNDNVHVSKLKQSEIKGD